MVLLELQIETENWIFQMYVSDARTPLPVSGHFGHSIFEEIENSIHTALCNIQFSLCLNPILILPSHTTNL